MMHGRSGKNKRWGIEPTKRDMAFKPDARHASWCQHSWCPPSWRDKSIDAYGRALPDTTCSCSRSGVARSIAKINAAVRVARQPVRLTREVVVNELADALIGLVGRVA